MLIVDDEPGILELCEIVLKNNGYCVNCVENGRQAMELLEKTDYDVVLLDIMLPDTDGVELLGQIKDKCPKTDVIMMTAVASAETAVKAMKLGAYDYLFKPLNMDELSLVVKKCLEKRTMSDEISLLKQHKSFYETAKMAAITKIAMGLAQELNSPLFGLLASIRALQKRKDQPEANYDLLKEMKEAAEFCGKLIADLSSFTHPDSKEFTVFDCSCAIEKSLDLISHKLKTRNIEIIKIYSGLPKIKGNENQLQNAFINIIINAQEAMPEGGTLHITARVVPEGSVIQIEFTDTGCGISPENIVSIFDPFFSTKKVGEGIGLGLSVAYGILKMHKGSIEVKSEVGKGTTFILKFPCNQIASPQ